MKSLFNNQDFKEIMERLNNLKHDSKRQWGKMSVGQMVWHCQHPLIIAIKNRDKGNGNIFARLFFKKILFNDRPFKKNMPTPSQLKTNETKDFSVELEKLVLLTKEMHELKNRKSWNPHPLFGRFTHEEWGKMQYKHLNHHLNQFGV